MHKYEKIARKRFEILWKYYNENGQLLLVDIPRLTGASYENIWKTFEIHNLEMPIVQDSRKEKTRGKAERLNKEAKRLKQDYLTFRQVFKLLGKGDYRTGYVVSIEHSIAKYGFSIPEIRNDDDAIFYNSNPDDNFSEVVYRLHGVINPYCYPAGLQVFTYWIDWPKEGLTTYLLR